jgi:hypothetical protein
MRDPARAGLFKAVLSVSLFAQLKMIKGICLLDKTAITLKSILPTTRTWALNATEVTADNSIASRLSTRGLRPVSYAPAVQRSLKSTVGVSMGSGTSRFLQTQSAKNVKCTFFFVGRG